MFGIYSINTFYFMFPRSVPRSGPRNMRVYDPTTSTLSVSWEHAEGPVTQYRITYAQTTGDPIEEFVSMFIIAPNFTVAYGLINSLFRVATIHFLPIVLNDKPTVIDLRY